MTPKLPVCTARDAERVILQLGFLVRRQAGSHKIFVHPSDQRRVVVPVHGGDLKPGMLYQIIKDLGLNPAEFHNLLLGRPHRAA